MSKKKQQPLAKKASVQAPLTPPVVIERENSQLFILGATVVYALLLFFGLYNHEMWRDEIQPFLTASSCHSLSDFFNNWKVQSDTIIWYTTLFLLGNISTDPMVVQVFHGLLATVNVYLILRYAPFSRLNKILLCCGYYMLFEYGIISRGYCYTLFFLFLFCIVYQNTPKRYVLLSVILVMLANATGGYGLVLSGSLTLVLLSGYFFDKNNRFHFPSSYKEVWPIVIIIGAGLWFAMKSITPPDDSVYKQAVFLKYDSERFFLNIWRSVSGAYAAVPNFLELHFWNKNLFIHSEVPVLKTIMILFAFAVLIYCILLFSSRVASAAFYLSATIGMLFFSYINDHIYIGFYARHYGFLFIVFVISTWLFTEAVNQKRFSLPLLGALASRLHVEKWMKYSVVILFAINAAGGLAAYAKDMNTPFSTLQVAGHYVMDNHLDHLPATGFTDYAISPVAAYTRKPIYYPDRDTTSEFVIWTISKYTTDGNQIIPRMMNFIAKQKDSVLVLLNFDLNTSMIGDVSFSKLVGFKESVVADETLYLYIAQKFDMNRELANLSGPVAEERIPGYINMAYGLLQQGKIAEGEKIMEKISGPASVKNIARFHSVMGALYLKKNLLGLAKEEFQKEIALGQSKEEAYFQLGMAHYQGMNMDSARINWEEVTKLNPNNIDALANLGIIAYNFNKDYVKAEEMWSRAVKVNPRYTQMYVNLMMNCQAKNDENCLLNYLKIALVNGMSVEEIRSKGIAITDQQLAKVRQ